MKKWLAIVLCSAYFLASNPLLSQLAKLPILIEHFQEHKALDGSISFWNYMYMHYFDDTEHDDWTRDNQLPFKQINNITTFLSIAVLPQTLPVPQKKAFLSSPSPRPLVFWSIGYISTYQNLIFQPPRTA